MLEDSVAENTHALGLFGLHSSEGGREQIKGHTNAQYDIIQRQVHEELAAGWGMESSGGDSM